MTTYKSGKEAIDLGLITESQWQEAISHPWTWVIISDTLKIREIPWQGLELEGTDCESRPLQKGRLKYSFYTWQMRLRGARAIVQATAYSFPVFRKQSLACSRPDSMQLILLLTGVIAPLIHKQRNRIPCPQLIKMNPVETVIKEHRVAYSP